MKGILRWLITSQMKQSKLARKTGGFTLIELLVAMIIAALVLTPLLGFMINILDTDRKEQAKANSEQEIQAALDYIAQDLEQALYIYDSGALTKSTTTDPATSGIKDEIPPVAPLSGCVHAPPTNICQPKLVFWKRDYRKEVVDVVGNPAKKDDTFVYSLVAYYLIKGNDTQKTWSNAARIARFEIRDGVKNSATLNDPNDYVLGEEPSPGFQPFDRKKSLNQWEKSANAYDASKTKIQVLVDYIDYIDVNNNGFTGPPPAIAGQKTKGEISIRGNARQRINLGSCGVQDPFCPSVKMQIKERGVLGQ